MSEYPGFGPDDLTSWSYDELVSEFDSLGEDIRNRDEIMVVGPGEADVAVRAMQPETVVRYGRAQVLLLRELLRRKDAKAAATDLGVGTDWVVRFVAMGTPNPGSN